MRSAVVAVISAVGLLAVLHSIPAKGEPVVWRVEDGGNGHRYEAVDVPDGIAWSDAKTAAEEAGGHLATIASEAENDFVFSLIDIPEFWNSFTYRPGPVHLGPWLGGFQLPGAPEPDEEWQWVTSEPFDFINWQRPVGPHPGEPNDWEGVNEDRLAYTSVFNPDYASFWTDLPDAPELGNPKGYIIEFPALQLQAGDADQDVDFDPLDLVRVQQAAKYLTGEPATWGEGDWDGAPGGEPGSPPAGNGLFDQADIIAALAAGHYMTGPYAAVRPGGQRADGQASVVYDARTGELAVDAPALAELTSINIDSAAGIFTGQPAQNLGGSFDNDGDTNVFKATFGGSFGSLSFGNVAQPGLSEAFLLSDLTVVGSRQGGGDLGEVDLIYVPEPSAAVLAVLASWLVAVHGFVARCRVRR